MIQPGEVGLASFLYERGITTAALMRKHGPGYQRVGYQSLMATVEDLEMRVPLNPTHHV